VKRSTTCEIIVYATDHCTYISTYTQIKQGKIYMYEYTYKNIQISHKLIQHTNRQTIHRCAVVVFTYVPVQKERRACLRPATKVQTLVMLWNFCNIRDKPKLYVVKSLRRDKPKGGDAQESPSLMADPTDSELDSKYGRWPRPGPQSTLVPSFLFFLIQS
jgi:hypothetical protein